MTEQTEHTEAQTNGATPPPNEIEDRARKMGWVAKEEFKGDPDRWRPADEFVSRGENLLPILQANNRKLEGRLADMETKNKQLLETMEELTVFTRTATERERKKAREEALAEITEAAKTADPERASRAAQTLSAIDAAPAPQRTEQRTEPEKPKADPEIQAWIGENKWFNTSPKLNGYALETYGELERDAPGMSTAERLAETKKRTMEAYPEAFGMSKRATAASVASPSGGPAPKKGRTYDDLPADAKRACDKFVGTIKGYKREDYVRDYDWSSQ